MSIYKGILEEFISKKLETIQTLRKKMPLMCQKFFLDFTSMPALPIVTLHNGDNIVQFTNELDIKMIDLISKLFVQIKDATLYSQINHAMWDFLTEYEKCFYFVSFKDIGLNCILSFILQVYNDYYYFSKMHSIPFLFQQDFFSNFDPYLERMNPMIIEKFETVKNLNEETECIDLQNLFFQLPYFVTWVNPTFNSPAKKSFPSNPSALPSPFTSNPSQSNPIPLPSPSNPSPFTSNQSPSPIPLPGSSNPSPFTSNQSPSPSPIPLPGSSNPSPFTSNPNPIPNPNPSPLPSSSNPNPSPLSSLSPSPIPLPSSSNPKHSGANPWGNVTAKNSIKPSTSTWSFSNKPSTATTETTNREEKYDFYS